MENEKKQKIPRRSFLFSITGLVAGSTLLTPSILNGMDEKEWIPKTKLSPEELKYIEKSKMA